VEARKALTEVNDTDDLSKSDTHQRRKKSFYLKELKTSCFMWRQRNISGGYPEIKL
jgi:hypothetical protein